jgi:Cu/Ag efflux protein CusF
MLKELASMAIAFALIAPVAAQTAGGMAATAPGKAMVAETIRATATITAIDKTTRDITLKGPRGELMTVTAGSEVKNFDKLKVGDSVDMQYVEALTLELKKGGGLVVGRTDAAGGAGAKPGATPAGAIGRQVTIVADVIATDPAKQTVTLKGPKQTVDLRIADPEQFKRVAKGDQIEAKFTQAFAVSVEPTAKK